jgi:hypothetical protein
MSKLTVNDLKMIGECEGLIYQCLGDRLDLVPLLTRRICSTFSLKVDEVFPHVALQATTPVLMAPAVVQTTAVTVPSTSSIIEEKKDSPSGTGAAKTAPVVETLTDIEKSVNEFASLIGGYNGLEGILDARKQAIPTSKGSYKTHLTKLKSVSSDVEALITVLLKARSSADISGHQLASFNNMLIAFVTQCDKILLLDKQPLPSSALRTLKQLVAKGDKLCKVWSLARSLPSNHWKYNGNLGNVTEVREQGDAQSGDGVDAEW